MPHALIGIISVVEWLQNHGHQVGHYEDEDDDLYVQIRFRTQSLLLQIAEIESNATRPMPFLNPNIISFSALMA